MHVLSPPPHLRLYCIHTCNSINFNDMHGNPMKGGSILCCINTLSTLRTHLYAPVLELLSCTAVLIHWIMTVMITSGFDDCVRISFLCFAAVWNVCVSIHFTASGVSTSKPTTTPPSSYLYYRVHTWHWQWWHRRFTGTAVHLLWEGWGLPCMEWVTADSLP